MSKILLVEDDVMMQRVIRTVLSREGYAVETASNGKEALEKLHEQQFNYDLIITDVMLPFVTGFELIAEIQKQAKDRMAIIIISSLSNENSILEGFGLGADDYIKKPIIASELLVRVKRLLFPKNRQQ